MKRERIRWLDNWLYFGYTTVMKTAISLPDSLYEAAERTAKRMGIPRSQLYAQALAEFLQHHTSERITEKLNEVYSQLYNSTFELLSYASLESLRKLTAHDSW